MLLCVVAHAMYLVHVRRSISLIHQADAVQLAPNKASGLAGHCACLLMTTCSAYIVLCVCAYWPQLHERLLVWLQITTKKIGTPADLEPVLHYTGVMAPSARLWQATGRRHVCYLTAS
jgi:hypothetical protein